MLPDFDLDAGGDCKSRTHLGTEELFRDIFVRWIFRFVL